MYFKFAFFSDTIIIKQFYYEGPYWTSSLIVKMFYIIYGWLK